MSKDCRTISEPKWPCYFGCCKTEKTFNWGVPNLGLRLLLWDNLRLGPMILIDYIFKSLSFIDHKSGVSVYVENSAFQKSKALTHLYVF